MTVPDSWQDGMVLLPVPLKYAHQVAQYSAALTSGRPTPTATDLVDAESVLVPGQARWTQEMVGRLADTVTYDGVLALLDRCASRSSQWVPKADVEAAGGFSAIQLRNELGAFSKKTRKLFGEPIWPMEWKKERGVYSYRLDPVVAQWWATARKDVK